MYCENYLTYAHAVYTIGKKLVLVEISEAVCELLDNKLIQVRTSPCKVCNESRRIRKSDQVKIFEKTLYNK